MAKQQMPRITEPDENVVHYQASGLSGNVTLCGLTDFIGHANSGKYTTAPANCAMCIDVRNYCAAYAPHKDAAPARTAP